ncbi:hypothetical protein GMST_40000 [Geomonas silvestris]|uniref:Uncharacterized protein n=1 Tax=Geomonas silvestris TaxID=2740184 RepID=A0A6V8MNN6_9BACT|nr:hypothetical protein [Geomonas silvestris]GFO61675.1 hypothetical protein GMST_40000 [Geomonas silvestris]
MTLYDDFKNHKIFKRLSEQQIYAILEEELQQGIKSPGLWAKALEKSGGEEKKALSLYISLRYQAILDEMSMLAMMNASSRKLDPPQGPAEPPPVSVQTVTTTTTSGHEFDGVMLFMLFILGAVIVGLPIYFMFPSFFSLLGPTGNSVHYIGVLILIGVGYLLAKKL